MSFRAIHVLLAVVLVTICRPALAAPSEAELRLLDRVRNAYRATREAITSIECNYTIEMHGAIRRCVYARAGEKLYHASIQEIGNDGLGLPVEVAWNGQRAWSRSALNSLTTDRLRDLAKPGCPLPHDLAGSYMDGAFGIEKQKFNQYSFRSAREMQIDGSSMIELTFVLENSQKERHAVTATFDSRLAYAPVHTVLTDESGKVLAEIASIKYIARELNGKTIHYPIDVPFIVGSGQHCVVDVKSLRINQPIDEKRFSLTPWPSEEVWERDTDKFQKPKDPNWSPVGNVSFPFDRFAAIVYKNSAEQMAAAKAREIPVQNKPALDAANSSISTNVTTAGVRSTDAKRAPQLPALSGTALPPPPVEDAAWRWFWIGGVIVLAVVALYVWRSRREVAS